MGIESDVKEVSNILEGVNTDLEVSLSSVSDAIGNIEYVLTVYQARACPSTLEKIARLKKALAHLESVKFHVSGFFI